MLLISPFLEITVDRKKRRVYNTDNLRQHLIEDANEMSIQQQRRQAAAGERQIRRSNITVAAVMSLGLR